MFVSTDQYFVHQFKMYSGLFFSLEATVVTKSITQIVGAF